MEYIQSNANNLNVYVDEFHTRMKTEFLSCISKIYHDEINVYSDIIEMIVKLPFIKKIIDENNELKRRINELEKNTAEIKLEIHDKPIVKNIVNIETIPFGNTVSDDDDDDDEDEVNEEIGRAHV